MSFKVVGSFPDMYLTTLWTNILVYDITGFIIEKTGYREVVNRNKIQTKLRVKFSNKFLNVPADKRSWLKGT